MVITKTDAFRLAANRVAIVGSEIYMPADWSRPNGTTTSTPVFGSCSSYNLDGLSAQQQRAELIAAGVAELLNAPEDVRIGIQALTSDPGGVTGARAIYRRAEEFAALELR